MLRNERRSPTLLRMMVGQRVSEANEWPTILHKNVCDMRDRHTNMPEDSEMPALKMQFAL